MTPHGTIIVSGHCFRFVVVFTLTPLTSLAIQQQITIISLIFMETCIVIWLVVITNKMQLSYRIYYSTYVSSSTCIERYVAHHQEPQLYLSLWFTNACGVRPWCCLSGEWVPTQTAPRADSASVCKPEAQIQLRFLMMSDIALETCWTIDVCGIINSVTELHLGNYYWSYCDARFDEY
jgi:hypothetical protein